VVKYKSHYWAQAGCRLCLLGLVIGIAGCGARGFAPDSVVENPGASAFLAQIGKHCGDLNMGTADINWLLQSDEDVYFVDETTKLYFGDVSRAQYADDLGSFYPVGDATKALPCIYQQLPATPPQR
jgi:hypothetical protein